MLQTQDDLFFELAKEADDNLFFVLVNSDVKSLAFTLAREDNPTPQTNVKNNHFSNDVAFNECKNSTDFKSETSKWT